MNSYSQFEPSCGAVQARSRGTEARLVSATLQLLSEGGLEACQIPAIAARAGVAVGTVYRRFRDKEALLDRAFLVAGETSATGAEDLQTRLAAAGGLSLAVRVLVETFTVGYAANARFYMAFTHYAQRREDAAFHDSVRRSRAVMLDRMVDGLMDAGRTDGLTLDRREVAFALTALTATLNALLVSRTGPDFEWSDDEARVTALVRLVERYLRP